MGAAPLSFKCARLRRIYYEDQPRHRAMHVVTLTGRTKAQPPSGMRPSTTRSRNVSREYRCSCGHVGWSTHADLERRALAATAAQAPRA